MSLAPIFQCFAGKIVRCAEFTQAIKDNGIDVEAIKSSPEALRARVQQLKAEGYDVSVSEPTTYLDAPAIDLLEAAMLAAPSVEHATEILQNKVADMIEAGTPYMDLAPVMKVVALTHADTSITDAYARAAQKCKDCADMLANDALTPMSDVLEGICVALERKFSL